MIRGQLLAIGFGDQPAAGDAQQRVVGFVILGGGEMRLVGRHQRQALGIGEIDQPGFDAALLLDAVALQLDVEPVAEQPASRSQRVAASAAWSACSASEIGPSGPPVSAIKSWRHPAAIRT